MVGWVKPTGIKVFAVGFTHPTQAHSLPLISLVFDPPVGSLEPHLGGTFAQALTSNTIRWFSLPEESEIRRDTMADFRL
jgi:hypothetical protein